MADYMVAEIEIAGLRSRCRAVEGRDTDTTTMLARCCVYLGVMEEHSHNNEDGNENRKKSRPCNPSDLFELSWASSHEDHDRRDDREVVCAHGVVGESIQGRGCTHDS
jgi:hypothetical protein